MRPSARRSPMTKWPRWPCSTASRPCSRRELIAAKSGGGDPSRMPIFVHRHAALRHDARSSRSSPAIRWCMAPANCMAFNDVVHGVTGRTAMQSPIRNSCRRSMPSALRQIGARYLASRCTRATAPEGRAHHRQDAVELLFRRAHSSGAAECQDHPHDPRSRRHLHLLLLEAVHGRAKPHLRSRRARPLLQTLRAADGALAPRAAAAEHSRCPLRRGGRRISKARHGASSPIAACPGTIAVCRSIETDRPVRTASATQVRQPIYQSAVGRARVYQDFLGPLLTALGSA